MNVYNITTEQYFFIIVNRHKVSILVFVIKNELLLNRPLTVSTVLFIGIIYAKCSSIYYIFIMPYFPQYFFRITVIPSLFSILTL